MRGSWNPRTPVRQPAGDVASGPGAPPPAAMTGRRILEPLAHGQGRLSGLHAITQIRKLSGRVGWFLASSRLF